VAVAGVDELGPGVVAFKHQSLGEAAFEGVLPGVVDRVGGGVIERLQIGELRVGAQQVAASDGGRQVHAIVDDAEEGVGDLLVEGRAQRHVLGIELVEFEPPSPLLWRFRPRLPT
jgi:hypothetical protein